MTRTKSYLVYVTLRGRVVGRKVPIQQAETPADAAELALKGLAPSDRPLISGLIIKTVKDTTR